MTRIRWIAAEDGQGGYVATGGGPLPMEQCERIAAALNALTAEMAAHLHVSSVSPRYHEIAKLIDVIIGAPDA
jgi:hypothetical protein